MVESEDRPVKSVGVLVASLFLVAVGYAHNEGFVHVTVLVGALLGVGVAGAIMVFAGRR